MGKNKLPLDLGGLAYLMCEKFMNGEGAEQIAGWLTEELQALGHVCTVTRNQVYPLLAKYRDKYLLLIPPVSERLGQRLADLYALDRKRIRVVTPGGDYGHDPASQEQVAAAAAELVLDLVRLPAPKKGAPPLAAPEQVGIGLANGWTTRQIAQRLGKRCASPLEWERFPPLLIHALTSGFEPSEPESAPIAMFAYFSDCPKVEYYAMYATTSVPASDYEQWKRSSAAKACFANKDKVGLVITSLAPAIDREGQLNKFVALRPDEGAALHKMSWIGDVMYRPFSAEGPIHETVGERAVTLFEIEELVASVREGTRQVVLVAGPTRDDKSKSAALKPLLENPDLKVWSHLVVDNRCAWELIEDKQPPGGETSPFPRPLPGNPV